MICETLQQLHDSIHLGNEAVDLVKKGFRGFNLTKHCDINPTLSRYSFSAYLLQVDVVQRV